MEEQMQLQKSKELKGFEKMHSEAFMYFLEEYDKWVELKRKVSTQKI